MQKQYLSVHWWVQFVTYLLDRKCIDSTIIIKYFSFYEVGHFELLLVNFNLIYRQVLKSLHGKYLVLPIDRIFNQSSFILILANTIFENRCITFHKCVIRCAASLFCACASVLLNNKKNNLNTNGRKWAMKWVDFL